MEDDKGKVEGWGIKEHVCIASMQEDKKQVQWVASTEEEITKKENC
jgi:hypothetical protein